jgi:hypothetical protein
MKQRAPGLALRPIMPGQVGFARVDRVPENWAQKQLKAASEYDILNADESFLARLVDFCSLFLRRPHAH